MPLTFAAAHQPLGPRAIVLGAKEGWLDDRDVVDWAVQRVVSGSEAAIEVEVAGLVPGEMHRLVDLLPRLEAAREPEPDPRLVWMRVLVAWTFEHRHSLEAPLRVLEELWAGFGYPDEIRHLIAYMPSDAPIARPGETGEQALARLWGEYVGSMRGESRRLEAIEERLSRLIGRAELPEGRRADLQELVRHGEPGIALENLCTHLCELGVPVSGDVLEALSQLAAAMGMNLDPWFPGSPTPPRGER